MSQSPPVTPPANPPLIPTVSVSDVTSDAVILDVREPDEWAAGHAPGAIHIPLGDLPARLAELEALRAGAGVGAVSMAVTCRGGGRSSRAVTWLTQQGYDVANLHGGMLAWFAAGKPLVSDGDVPPNVK
jgi:rhodanese-related sulfurtransferase